MIGIILYIHTCFHQYKFLANSTPRGRDIRIFCAICSLFKDSIHFCKMFLFEWMLFLLIYEAIRQNLSFINLRRSIERERSVKGVIKVVNTKKNVPIYIKNIS